MLQRGSGILLHITSLPSRFGIGDLGPDAYRFVDELAQMKQTYWQVLPLSRTEAVYGHSPYSSISAFAGNTLLISPQFLCDAGFLTLAHLDDVPAFPADECDYDRVQPYKEGLYDLAFQAFQETGNEMGAYASFCERHAHWLDDYALFVILKRRFGGRMWSDWPSEFRDRNYVALDAVTMEAKEDLEREKFLQFLFYKQWKALKVYANSKGIKIIGDIPYYVSYDSVDVWTHRDLFKLDTDGRPLAVAGVPPDYFSATGQLWGNPVYDWTRLKETGFAWWLDRLRENTILYDYIRIDHFRGLVAYWEVPRGETTAVNGSWVHVPVDDFLRTVQEALPQLELIAEDLGIITDDVRECMKRFHLPGMKILMFAFYEDKKDHPYLPHTYEENCVVYTGTHDNNTVQGWWQDDMAEKDKERLCRYLNHALDENNIHSELITLAMKSRAQVALIPLQDILGLDGSARMNLPATGGGNWRWRVHPDAIGGPLFDAFRDLTLSCNRAQ